MPKLDVRCMLNDAEIAQRARRSLLQAGEGLNSTFFTQNTMIRVSFGMLLIVVVLHVLRMHCMKFYAMHASQDR